MNNLSLEIKFTSNFDKEIENYITAHNQEKCNIILKKSSQKGIQPSLGQEIVELIVRFTDTKVGETLLSVALKELFSLLIKKGIKKIQTKKGEYPTTDEGLKKLKKVEFSSKRKKK